MLANKTTDELMNYVISDNRATEAELLLVERLGFALDEIESLMQSLREVEAGLVRESAQKDDDGPDA